MAIRIAARPLLRTLQGLPRCSRPEKLACNAVVRDMTHFQDQKFSHIVLSADHQFAQTELSYAFVNLKPIVEGHVLCCPKRIVQRFADLNPKEVADIWQLAQLVGKILEARLEATSLTLAIQEGPDLISKARVITLSFMVNSKLDKSCRQLLASIIEDGPDAGQSIPHVHIHVLPRRKGDFERNDDIYEVLDNPSAERNKTVKMDMDKDRQARSHTELVDEASVYRKWFETS